MADEPTVSGPEGIASLRWWMPEFKPDKRRAEACSRWLGRAMVRWDLRRRVNLFNAQLYEDVPALGLGPYQYSVYDLGTERLRMNLIRAVVNTYVSFVSRGKPLPKILTNDGPWSLQRKAKGLRRWCEGKAAELELFDEISNPCCRDSAVFSPGLAKVYREWPEKKELWDVGVERVFPWELVIDDAEGQQPRRLRNMAHRRWYDRGVAMEMFPGSKKEIAKAPRNDAKYMTRDWSVDSTADLVNLSELWHLPAYPGAGDGLHIIMIEGKILFEEAWERQTFPFAMLFRDTPTMGMYGTSIPHELRGLHVDINQTLIDIQECLRLNGKPRVMAPVGAMEKEAWDDDVDSIIEWTGQQQPILYSPQVMPPEQYTFLWQKWAKGFEQVGLTEQSGMGAISANLSGSGASIDAEQDIKDGRMANALDNFQKFHMKIFDLMIEEGRAIAKSKPEFATGYRGKTRVQIVKFKDVDPGKDKFYLQAYPESRLARNPKQRLAQLNELANANRISPEEFRELLDFPDLEGEDSLQNAPRHLCKFLMEKFSDADDPEAPDVFVYPEPDWPLAQLKQYMTLAKINLFIEGCPDGNLRLFTQFIQMCDLYAERQRAAQAAQAAPAGAPGPPGMSPGAGPPPGLAPTPPPQLLPPTQAPTMQ